MLLRIETGEKNRKVFLQREQPKACNFIKKETLALVFSCEFCEIEHLFLQTTSSGCFCQLPEIVHINTFSKILSQLFS